MRILFGLLTAWWFFLMVVSIMHPTWFSAGAQVLYGSAAIAFLVLFLLSLKRR